MREAATGNAITESKNMEDKGDNAGRKKNNNKNQKTHNTALCVCQVSRLSKPVVGNSGYPRRKPEAQIKKKEREEMPIN